MNHDRPDRGSDETKVEARRSRDTMVRERTMEKTILNNFTEITYITNSPLP